MAAVDPRVYKAIFRVKSAYAFDIGGFLMRLYCYMTNIGVVSMLTLAGYSFFEAGLVASVIALAVFLISPRIAKLIDERGQGRIIPKVACLPMAGTIAMIVAVLAQAPLWMLFPCAVLMGGIAGPQALVRARWTYLLRTGRLQDPPELRVAFSYEAVLDDIAFMISPALSIFLASAIMPVAGLAVGVCAYAAGAALLTVSRSTEPAPGWARAHGEETTKAAEAAAEEPSLPEGEEAQEGLALPSAARPKSVFRTSAVVRVIFLMLFFLGAFFGSLDSTVISLAEELEQPTIASMVLMAQAFTSIVVGFLFGMVRLRVAQYAQLVITAVLFGTAFAMSAFIDSAFLLFAITVPASLFYAPFLITANATCERAVPGSQLTEAITWINAGVTGGMTVGPTLAGTLIDAFGTQTSFVASGALAAMVAVVALLALPLLKRNVR